MRFDSQEKGIALRRTLLVAVAAVFVCFGSRARCAELWSTAYYPGWTQGSLPASNIDFTALSHVIHFALAPNPDGTLNGVNSRITPDNASDLVSRAHAAGKKALLCVGGASTELGFQGATSSANLGRFITNLVNFTTTYDYDGIDVDWEPLPAADFPQYTQLVNGLRSALEGFAPPKLLTAAVAAYPAYGDPPASEYSLFAELQGRFDQINIMTYDLSGAYAGWVTWFNSPLYDGGYHFSSTGGLVPSIDGAVSNFVSNGVAPRKLGIAIAFYGDVWAGGVSRPRQSWRKAPAVTQVPFTDIMSSYYQSNFYHWDTNAQAAYLSIGHHGSAKDVFVSYDDERACEAKVRYARKHCLGGIMIWQLAQGYLDEPENGDHNPLIQAVKQALAALGVAVNTSTNGAIGAGSDLQAAKPVER